MVRLFYLTSGQCAPPPCRTIIPRLNEWHERFADKDVAIVALTRYYGQLWDSVAKRTRNEGTPHDVEQETLASFAKHHGMRFPIGIMTEDAQTSSAYGITSIPRLVLIDQEGIVG